MPGDFLTLPTVDDNYKLDSFTYYIVKKQKLSWVFRIAVWPPKSWQNLKTFKMNKWLNEWMCISMEA